MGEHEPQGMEGLLRELEEEYGAPEPLPPEVETLVRELLSAPDSLARYHAATVLGRIGMPDRQVGHALLVASQSDSHPMVRSAAAKVLKSPVHQELLRQDAGPEERTIGEAAKRARQHLEEAFALEEQDEYERALQECDAALRLDPGLVEAHNLRGVILEELGRETEAITAYRKALRLEPDCEIARDNLREAEAELRARRPAIVEEHARKKSLSDWESVAVIAFGIVWMALTTAMYGSNLPGLVPPLITLVGAAVVAWGLWGWLSPSSPRNKLDRSMRETTGRVGSTWTEKHRDDDGTRTTYHAKVLFEAVDTQENTRRLELRMAVPRRIWNTLSPGRSVTVRYSAEDPRIALIEGE